MGMSVASLFSGIGGIERGFEIAGHHVEFQCEILASARSVLQKRFSSCRLAKDLRDIRNLPTTDIVTAGFPCQDLSQAGKTRGIGGEKSSLVNHMFDLLTKKRKFPKWVLLENVPFMLQLQKGQAMSHITKKLEQLGMRWAYRVVDARAFGLPQRRRRVILLASRDHDPRGVLFADDASQFAKLDVSANAYGFYWTEGNTGIGWTVDGVPTLKGGSGLGIPCPPAVWLVGTGEIVTPDIRDAERLQGFPANWTKPAVGKSEKRGARWLLVGNAVPVPVSKWIGKRLSNPKQYGDSNDQLLDRNFKWPTAAWGFNGKKFRVDVSEWPKSLLYKSIPGFFKFPLSPLSYRATKGFYQRLTSSSLRRPREFDMALVSHIRSIAE